MRSLFAFEGRIRRLPYVLWSLAVFFSQHLVVLALAGAQARSLALEWWFYLVPLRSLVTLQASDLVLILMLAYQVMAAWVLAALAFRRAADADINDWSTVLAIAPLVQLPVILTLGLFPSRVARERPPAADPRDEPRLLWSAAAQGVVAGMALTLFAVAIGTLVFRVYGFGLFVVSPFVIGATTAYVANRRTDLGGSLTAQLVMLATALGGAALVAVAIEGLVCIVMAAPIGLFVAFIGGLLGRAIASSARPSAGQTVSALVVLPLVLAVESVLPPAASFDSYQTIEVGAPPEAVWASLVRMRPIDEPPALPFRLGIAYPLGGEIVGEGVGAIRHGEFSTGTALERVTEWVPNRKLAFVVVNDVPAMRELSPYDHVHAPHVVGYFRTTQTSFELAPRPDGRTEIIERTSHELKLDPVPYWLPMARWVVHANNARVLRHIRQQAEQSAGTGN
jgi:uncharacterized membrane protein YhaH (DUF805 family)